MRQSPWAVAAVVGACYATWLVWLVAGPGAVDAATVGQAFLGRSDASPSIEALAPSSTSRLGYDGQFVLFIALDPGDAWRYTDAPSYRYGRALLPFTARAVSLGQPGVVPYAILALNVAGVVGGTLALALLLGRRKTSVWWAAAFGLFPGLFFAFTRDLTEPLAYGLVAAALLAFHSTHGRGRVVITGGFLALAGLTRETSLVFAVALAIALLAESDTGRSRLARVTAGASFLAIAVLPYLALRIGLRLWLDAQDLVASGPGTGDQPHISPVPFRGLLDDFPFGRPELEQILTLIVPAFVVLVAALCALRWRSPWLLALTANVLVLVVLLPPETYSVYTASGRVMTGVVLAGVSCIPAIAQRGLTSAAWIAVLLWMMPWYWLLPTAFGR